MSLRRTKEALTAALGLSYCGTTATATQCAPSIDANPWAIRVGHARLLLVAGAAFITVLGLLPLLLATAAALLLLRCQELLRGG